MQDALTRTRLAQLLLVFAGFHLAVVVFRATFVPSMLSLQVLADTQHEWGSLGALRTLQVGIFEPLLAAGLMILASVLLRKGHEAGRWLALLLAVTDVLLFFFTTSPLPVWSAAGALLAAQAVQIWWRFSVRYHYDQASY